MVEFKKGVWGLNFIGPRQINEANDFEIGTAIEDGVEVPGFRLGETIFTVNILQQGGGGGGDAKRYKHKIVSNTEKFEIVNFSPTVLTVDNLADELRKGYCYIRYFYEDDQHIDKASDCLVVWQDGYFEGSWQDKAISLFYIDKQSASSATLSWTYLINPGIQSITDTVTEVE